MFEHIRYSEDDGIASIILDRSAKKNALNTQMLTDLRLCLEMFRDGSARAAIISSALPDIFCAGADLTDPPQNLPAAIPEFGFKVDKPIIAAVNGKAIGAAVVLVSMCDFVVMTEDASFIYPEAKIGVSKGGVSAVVRRLPLRIANELILLGEPISAQRAYDVGFVNRVVCAGSQVEAARDIARTVAANAPLVVEMLKRMTLDALGSTPVQQHIAISAAVARVDNSEDAKAALEAFRNKTRPVFHGR